MKRTQQKPTPEQLDLMPGDRVTVTLDDGTTAFDVVTDEPSKLGGHMWVAWLDDHGSYLLNRVQPIATLATSGADDDDGDGGRQDLGCGQKPLISEHGRPATRLHFFVILFVEWLI